MTQRKLKVLFLCTGNSCRSQMAEGIVNHDFKDEILAYSAGVNPTPINQYTVKVMEEIGIDIGNQYPKHVDVFKDEEFDLVITVCDHASRQCPIWLKKGDKVHIPIDDPYGMIGQDDEITLGYYRKARDTIREKIGSFLKDYLNKRESDN